jgi:glycosyltransferase involved in cell wall biosynthesis
MKLGVVCDLLEEGWPSMDLVADELIEQGATIPGVHVERIRPTLPATVGRAIAPSTQAAGVVRRWVRRLGIGGLRYAYYPYYASRERDFDWVHVADHSYAHLVPFLRRGRCGVFCHDIDAFRALFEPARRPWSRALASGTLLGLRQARVVFYSTKTVRDEILAQRLVPAERLVAAPYGVAADFQPLPRADDEALVPRGPFVLHVGRLVPRKNPEFLLRIVAAVRRVRPDLQFVQIGGAFTSEHRQLLRELGLEDATHQLRDLSRATLAAYYRRSSAVLLPSLSEGFGIPLIEALACGTPVVASDIAVFREVGTGALVYVDPSDLDAWVAAVLAVLGGQGPARTERLSIAARYSWSGYAKTIVSAYAALDAGRPFTA